MCVKVLSYAECEVEPQSFDIMHIMPRHKSLGLLNIEST